MATYRAAVVHASIDVPPRDAIAFLRDVSRWKEWAPWIKSVSGSTDGEWSLETEAGTMRIAFDTSDADGVLDHHVTLDSGLRVFNSMHIVPNDTGSELVMLLFQLPSASAEEFERDVQAVRDDLVRIKRAAEGATSS